MASETSALLAIDPGPVNSAFVVFTGTEFVGKGIVENDEVLQVIYQHHGPIAIESIASYGMAVGEEVFETCVWIGRMIQMAGGPCRVTRIKRAEVKMALCHATKGVNDAVIRQRLIDMYGPGKELAIGNKKKQGPLFGFKDDIWAAAAVAVAWNLVLSERAKSLPSNLTGGRNP